MDEDTICREALHNGAILEPNDLLNVPAIRNMHPQMPSLLLLLLALLFAGQIASAQSPSGDLAVHWQHYNIESGLSSQFVRDVTLDRNGFLWVATAKGLNRFDGRTFVPFGPVAAGHQVITDPAGHLWMGVSGLRDWVRLDSIPRFDPGLLAPLPAMHLPNVTNPRFMQTNSGVWITEDGGQIRHLAGAELTSSATLGDSIAWVEPIYYDPRLGSWFLWHHVAPERGCGLIHHRDGHFEIGPAHPDLQSALQRGATHWSSNGELILLGDEGHAEVRGPDTRRPAGLPALEGLQPSNAYLVENPYTRHTWVLTDNRLAILDMQGSVLWDEPITDALEWASHVTRVKFTSESDGWVCTNRGLTHIEVEATGFHSAAWLEGVPRENRAQSLRALLEWSPDTLIFCNDLGRIYRSVRTAQGWRASPILVPKGRGLANIARLPGNRLAILADEMWFEGPLNGPLLPVGATRIVDCWSVAAVDSSNRSWLIGHNGLSRFNRQTGRVELLTSTPEDRQEIGDVYAIEQTEAHRFLLGTTTGLWSYDDRNQTLEPVPGLPPGLSVHAIELQGASWWLGTARNGLVRYQPKTQSHRIYNRSSGLSDDRIYAVQSDSCGNLWLASDRGLMRFHPLTEAVDVYSHTEGLKQLEFNRTSHTRGAQGQLYFGGLEGLLKVDPNFYDCRAYEEQAAIGLIALDAYGEASDSCLNKLTEWAAGKRVILSPGWNILRAEWRLLEWGKGAQSYATRIVEGQSDWQETTAPMLRIAGLEPGDYTLEVRARFRSGAWSKNALRVPFRVEPKWTQTGAFRLGVVGLALFLLWFFYRQAQRRTERLEQLVAERTNSLREAVELKDLYLKEVHHRVKNNMQIVGNLLDLQTAHVQHEEAIRTLREGRARIASIALVHQELHQAGETKSLSFQHFARRLFGGSCQLFGWDAAAATLTLTGTDVEMDLETAIPIGLILNELITNTFKHGDPDAPSIHVNIHLRQLQSTKYSAHYDDHGPGLPEDVQFNDDHSIGLWLVAEMVRKLGGQVRVSKRSRSRLVWTFEEPHTP